MRCSDKSSPGRIKQAWGVFLPVVFHRLLQLGTLFVSTSLLSAEHWAFQPLKPGKEQSIDAYIQKELAEHGLKPAPRADARTLIRRAHFDLTGLPPSDVSDTSDLSDKPTPLIDASSHPALRRAMGTPLAGRGPLLGHQRLRLCPRGKELGACHAVSRLGRARAERRHAV
jgi:hypothetical protein